MEYQTIWEEQCRATYEIKERFGIKSALDYLVGEKLLTFAHEANIDPEFAAELPRFQAAVWISLIRTNSPARDSHRGAGQRRSPHSKEG